MQLSNEEKQLLLAALNALSESGVNLNVSAKVLELAKKLSEDQPTDDDAPSNPD